MTQRDRQDEAIGVIRRLFSGERVTHKSDWFTLNDAALQLLPLQEDMPFVVASQICPSGMTLAGKYGIGVHLDRLDVDAGPDGAADAMGLRRGRRQRRPAPRSTARDWRVLLSLAHRRDPRAGAQREAGPGLMRWHNEYKVGTLQRPGAASRSRRPTRRWRRPPVVERPPAAIGTPDDLVKTIKNVIEVSGGFGTVIGFVHDWANPETRCAAGTWWRAT